MTCSSCLFDVCSARYSALSQHTSLLPAACSRLLVLTYHEQHSVESGLLGPNINVSERTYFACAEAEQSGECGGVLGARGGEEGR